MTKSRLEAFSDGVIAIIITIMVLEIKVPHGASLEALRPLVPHLLSYLLSFVFVGIYWNNHHHLLHVARHVDGGKMWANLHLLFWLSLIPFATGWAGEHPSAAWPAALYGFLLFMAAIAYTILQNKILADHPRDSEVAAAFADDRKGKLSLLCYAAAIPLAFVHTAISDALYVIVAGIWLIPEQRIEKKKAT